MSALLVESQRGAHNATYRCVVPAGEPWLHEVPKGAYLRIVDLEGNQAVDTLFYNAHDYSDRDSAQDTIRQQGNIYLTAGTRLMSSSGNVLMKIVADTCGRHDTLGGACANESNMFIVSRPIEVDVSSCCVTETMPTPFCSNTSASRAKSKIDLDRRSIL